MRRSTKDRVLRHYNRHGASHPKKSGTGLVGKLIERDIQTVLALAQGKPGLWVLDVGSGPGVYAKPLAEMGMRVVAVDLAPQMVESVRPFVEQAVIGDIENLQLPNKTLFDRVLCIGVLDFVVDAEACIHSLAAHLASEGRLVVLAPQLSFGGLIYKLWHLVKNGIVVRLYRAKRLDSLAKKAGLTLVYQESLPFKHNLILVWQRTH